MPLTSRSTKPMPGAGLLNRLTRSRVLHLADRRRVVIGREKTNRDAGHRGVDAAAVSCSRSAAGSVTGRRQAKSRQR